MKIISLLLLVLIGIAFPIKAFEQRKSIPGFYIYNTAKNTAIKNGEAKITLHFSSINFSEIPKGYETIIYYSINEVADTFILAPGYTRTIQIKAGKTIFKFWPGPGYDEVISDTILIENQTTNDAQISFISENLMIEVDKPVIYLQTPVKLDFSLRVNPTNDFTFTYPPYTDQWKGTLYPNGEIEINKQIYPYLFWDSKQDFKLKDQSNGYRISKQEVIPFLEKQLSRAGLTPTEKTDFITYWGPRLTEYETVFIQFFLQEDCNQFATIQCDPKPETINRLYIGFSEWNETLTPFLHPIDLPAFKREGFNLLEWGGFELKNTAL
ncbi:MAG: hypothetical protein K0S23_1628 [Fluviicola sp.]|jgi:hypothetical protein|uniref:hypothetical protein n=1 Tax=Fluviicola sp. TaxID=1917219 RepID=UPI0026073538|nr:hypothetical protein [Fluviicola sp.]MDF3027321.1 hypothetical protein [Fluviicola sp.]